ncbi:MAG TPA: 2-aminoethylphosphonate--pyruvate transaminase [Myxococcales bacterium]|nr:2-aminoethylphosphonate--pyruvate transaminase [Myxococcales bacterium]
MSPTNKSSRKLLLNPGPVTLTERVRGALAREDLCHREPEFVELQRDVQARLARVYPEAEKDYEAVMITGSGTAAVEAMVGSLVPADGKALVVVNGVYGERIASILAAQKKPYVTVTGDWTRPFDLKEVEKKLIADPAITHVAAIHHETTTGRLNRVDQLGALCRERNVSLLLDTVSSFGGEEIRFDEWNLEACAATANKCLHGVPGMAFVLARKRAFTERKSGATSVYLDLYKHQQHAASGYPPFTPAVHSLFALQEALGELEEAGGWRARHERYAALSRQVMVGLRELGIELFLESPEVYSVILASYKMPSGLSYELLHDTLKDAGFIIYAGQGSFAGTIFRISTMGALTAADMDRLLAEVRKVLETAR